MSADHLTSTYSSVIDRTTDPQGWVYPLHPHANMEHYRCMSRSIKSTTSRTQTHEHTLISKFASGRAAAVEGGVGRCYNKRTDYKMTEGNRRTEEHIT